MAVVCAGALAAEARAGDFTWIGAAPVGDANWSNATNWGGTTPSGAVGTLTFPSLGTAACELEPTTTTCYQTHNDLAGLNVTALSLGCRYNLTGNAITLGAGGLQETCASFNNSFLGSHLGIPIVLGASQTWSIVGRMELGANVTGTSAVLGIELGGDGVLDLGLNDVEVGPITIAGEGLVDLSGGSLNATDGNPVRLTGGGLSGGGGGGVGALDSKGGRLELFDGNLSVSGGVTLDSTSEVSMLSEPGSYTELTATATVNLGNARLRLGARACPLNQGEEQALVRTGGQLSGTFAGLPDKSTIQVECFGGRKELVGLHYTAHSVVATAISTKSPRVVTEAANPVSPGSATLNGTVTPGRAISDCHFDFGETLGYGRSVPCTQTVGEGETPVPVSANLTGLTPGTTYHVRLVATSANGTSYGGDQAFTTIGTSAPTVQTGYAYGGWPSSATLTGVINPHGNSVTYEFRYGASPVQVASYSDILTGYWGSVAGSGALSGTTSQEVSANIGGLAADTAYYVRLVAFYDGLVTWGPEVRLEITPPEPQATEAPYLQVNGTDAAKGYRVRCQPGNWSYTNYNFQTQWVYVAQNGSTSPARSGAGKGTEYQVEQGDIGHPLACVVTPYKLDGHLATGPNTTLQSDLLLPEGTGLLVIPSWLKTAWNLFSFGDSSVSAWDTGLACGAAVLLPELFAEGCLVGATRFVLENALGDAFASAVDPPEANYQGIALPQPLATPRHRAQPCPTNLKSGPCRALVRLARAYATATGKVAGVIEAIAISRNRTLIAQKKGDTETLVVQEAARKVYFGMLATAIEEQRKTGAVYVAALRRHHLDVRLPVARVRALLGHGPASWERSLQRRMLTHGFDKASVRKAFAIRPKNARSFDFARTLATASPPAAFGRYYDEIDLNDLVALVSGLARQHAIPGSAVATLLSDLDKTRAACTPTARTAAAQRFLQDAKPNTQPQFYGFLSTAAQPFIDGASTVDPYPHCLS